jgi:hypothetical protein
MSNLYDKAREGLLAGEIVWKATGGSVIKAALVRGYTFNVSHKFLSEVIGAGGTIVATATLGSLTNTNGVADAADTVWTAVPEGAGIPHCIIYQASAVGGGADVAASAQRLITLIDSGPGLPLLPNGENVTSSWSPGADRIFRL